MAKPRRRRPDPADPGRAWIAVPGRRPGQKRTRLGRDARGRFRRVEVPLAHYRLYLEPPRLTYWPDGSFRVSGRRVTDAVAQHVVTRMVQDRIPEGLVNFVSDLSPAIEDAEDDDKVVFECNDSDMSIADVDAAYMMTGIERGLRNDPDELVEPDVSFSGDSRERIERYWREWEDPLRQSRFGRWAMAGKRIGVAISYYALAHKVVYEGSAKFAELVRVPYTPIGREGVMVLEERMRRLEERSDEPVEWVVAGFWMMVKVLT